MKKRIFALILTLVFVIAFISGCGNSSDNPGSGVSNTPASGSPSTGGNSTGGNNTGGNSTGGGNTTGGNVLAPEDLIAAPENKDVRYADLIDILTQTNVVVIDPHAPGANSVTERNIYTCIYDRLVIRTPEGEYVPELATSWEISDDMQTYTFSLRKDVSFHNGEKFTAQSVIDTVMISRENTGSLGFDAWRYVDTATALDEYTVEIVLVAPNADFLFLIQHPGASIINKAAREADPVSGAWVGTGAYFVSEFVSGDHIVLMRNDDYWGEPAITKQLYLRHVPEVATRTIIMQNNESQVCMSIEPTDMPQFVNNSDFVVYRIVSDAHIIFFNMNDSITGDLNFRLAVAHALERADIATVSAGDWALPASDGTIWGYSTEFRNNNIPIIPFDLDLARQCLEASSYNGEEVELMAGIFTTQRGGEMIQEQLAKVGINVRLNQTDVPTLSSTALYGSDKTQMIHHMLPMTLSAASARGAFYPGASSNRASYNNPVVNELLDRAPTIADQKEREALYMQIQEILAEDLPIINIYYRLQAPVSSSKIGGIIINPDQNHDFRGIFLVLDD